MSGRKRSTASRKSRPEAASARRLSRNLESCGCDRRAASGGADRGCSLTIHHAAVAVRAYAGHRAMRAASRVPPAGSVRLASGAIDRTLSMIDKVLSMHGGHPSHAASRMSRNAWVALPRVMTRMRSCRRGRGLFRQYRHGQEGEGYRRVAHSVLDNGDRIACKRRSAIGNELQHRTLEWRQSRRDCAPSR